MRRTLSLLSTAALALTALAASPATAAAPAPRPAAEEPPALANQLLVGYRPGATAADRASARSGAGSRLESVVVRGGSGQGVVELVTTRAGGRAQAERRFQSSAGVAYAEPNWIYQHNATSNDPAFLDGSLWGMQGDASAPANAFGSQAAEAWAAGGTGSDEVYVGVIDEGIQVTHPDLAPNVWENPFDPVDRVDNDGNGYVDDVHGWDFAGGDSSVYDGPDDNHGTHVAGTIGAQGGNGTGVAGVAWNVTMISGKFLGANGGTTDNAIKAVDYFTGLKTRHGLNIVATNNSWGGGGHSQALADAIERANAAGILFIASAGNGGSDGIGDDNDATPRYPSGYPNDNIIAVASLESSGAKSTFSNYGRSSVDLGAPGGGIRSTVPDGYGTYSGTSMATPHVTGAAALLAASKPGATAADLKAAILGSTAPTTSLDGTVTQGRLDAGAFVPTAPGDIVAPATPTGVTAQAVASGGAVTVAWAPVGDADVTGYEVYRSGTHVLLHTAAASTTSWTEFGLKPGTSYSYVVRAVDGAGNRSAASAPVSVTATAPPLAVSGSGARIKGGHQVTLSISGGDPAQPLTIKRTGTSSRTFTVTYATSVVDKITTKATSGTYYYEVCQATCSPTATVAVK